MIEIEQVEKEIEHIFPIKKTTRQSNNSSLTQLCANKITKKFENLAKLCGIENKNEFEVNSKVLNIKQELSNYISSKNEYDADFEKYWQNKAAQLPMLASLAKKYCKIPASSVPSESSFSIGNHIQRKERSALSSKNLRYSMILRDKNKIEHLLNN